MIIHSKNILINVISWQKTISILNLDIGKDKLIEIKKNKVALKIASK
ncbi:hypothetical protein [Borreliella lanei]|uniref:Uncharacterized protein n=1 Tax=Borreliella lanei TaxID=373540 RepID=A0A7X0DJZ6_9SPIR|nr:hypothetical protein [Borreliella lanei]MBB6208456.1 hypothetical protein [Borreliella lanei]